MAVISVRLNSEEEKSTIIKYSLKDLFEDIQDRETIQKF